jgi:parallel beta-helix repeat protein
MKKTGVLSWFQNRLFCNQLLRFLRLKPCKTAFFKIAVPKSDILKRPLLISALAAAALLLFGCELFLGPEAPAGTGSLSIGFGTSGGGGARALTAADLETLRYDLVLTGPRDQSIEASISAGETFSRQVALGEWHITVTAYAPGGILAGTGSASVVVKRENNLVQVPMTPSDTFGGGETTVDDLNLTSLVTAPATGVAPNTSLIDETQYTGAIAWLEADGTSFTGNFAPSMVYKAVVTLTAKTGFTFTDLAANAFAYTGATLVTNAANSGTVTITFPATAAGDALVTLLNLTGLVTVPVTGGTPDTTITGTQYTGTIEWFEENDDPAPSPFAASTVYKAVIALTTETGFTFAGLEADAFTYAGATDSSPVGTGTTITVTITFPITAPPVSANIRYVTPSGSGDGSTWANASNDLQAMIDAVYAAASSPKIVHVAAGTYKPIYKPKSDGTTNTDSGTAGRDATFILRAEVEIRGGYVANEGYIADATREDRFNPDGTVKNSSYATILSGDIGDSTNTDNVYHVVLGVNIPDTDSAVLDGLTITKGYADTNNPIVVDGQNIQRVDGGGIYNYSSSPELKRVTITGNHAGNGSEGTGGGMYNTTGSSPVLTAVTVSNNTASASGGGIYNAASSSPELRSVTISNNTASRYGGGMYNTGSSPTLIDVSISDNKVEATSSADGDGGGIYNTSSSPVLLRVRITGNWVHNTVSGSTPQGGGIYCGLSSAPVLINVLIAGNKAYCDGTDKGNGGGIFIHSGSPTLTNVTIAGNSAAYGGAITYNSSGSGLTITNSVIWGNSSGINSPGMGSPTISYSLVQGSSDTSNNNLPGDTDPNFVTPKAASDAPTSGGNYELGSVTPVVNAGDDASYIAARGGSFTGEKDLAGGDRKVGTHIDMGAYEKQ